MDEAGSPLDILGHEITLSEFMSSVSAFDDAYSEYSKERRTSSGSEKPTRNSARSLGGSHPILLTIYNTRRAINEFFRTEELPINDQVKDTVAIGRAISNLESTPVVDPNGKLLSQGVSQEFAGRLWKEEDYWDTVFELEVASALEEANLGPKLVDERGKTGPDVIVESANNDVWIECKRKRPKTKEETEQESTINEIIDDIYNQVDIEKDSLAIEIRGPRLLRRPDVSKIVSTATELVENQKIQTKEVAIEEDTFEIELIDYYEGEYTTNIRPEWLKMVQEYIDIGNAVDIFSHLDYNIDSSESYGHAEAQFKVSEEGNIKIINGYMIGVNCSEELDYVKWIMQTIKSARSQLSGHPPVILFVDVPASKIQEMDDLYVTNHRGEEVSQDKRLEERIYGQLNDSNTIGGIIITSRINDTIESGFRQGRVGSAYLDRDAETELPPELIEFLPTST